MNLDPSRVLAARIHPAVYTTAIILVCSAVFIKGPAVTTVPMRPAALIAAIVFVSVPLIFRRRHAPLVLGIELALFMAGAYFGIPATVTAVPVLFAIYAVSRWRPRMASFIAMTVTGMILFVVVLLTDSGNWWEPRAIIFLAWTGLFAITGVSTQTHRSFLAAIADRAKRAEDAVELESARRVAEERLRISRDLHDTLAHDIAVINIHAGLASAALRREPEIAEESLKTIRVAAQDVLTDIGNLLASSRAGSDPAEEQLGPEHGSADPVIGTANLDGLLAKMRSTGMEIRFERHGAIRELPTLVDTTIYRVIQEGLTNAHKHGIGASATVKLDLEGANVTIEIRNPFIPGIEQPEAHPGRPQQSGLGLVGIRERIAMVGGQVKVETIGATGGSPPTRGQGEPAEFLVCVTIPQKPAATVEATSMKGTDQCPSG